MVQDILDTRLDEFFSTAVANAFMGQGCERVRDVLGFDHRKVLHFRYMGWVRVREIELHLRDHGISWPGYEIPYPKITRPAGPQGSARYGASGIKRTGFVYLMTSGNHGYLKIGFSAAPSMREETLQAQDPLLKMTWSVRASGGFESWLHDRFSAQRIRGEWFNLGAADKDFITSGAALAEFSL